MGYSADQIIGKTMYAAQKVPVKDLPFDDSPAVAYVQPGNIIGIVYSWVGPKPEQGRSLLYWMYARPDGSFFFTPHVESYYDLQKLKDQGIVSDQEIREKEEYENLPWYEQLLTKYGKPLVVAGLATAVVIAAVKGYFSRPTKN
jgi:hypothetical protein